MIERSLVLIKPDAVQRGLVGDIIKRFEHTGLKIVAMKMVWVDDKFAKEHYKAHAKKSFFVELVELITESPVVAIVIEGAHAVQNIRKMVGATSPNEAAPGTIRGDFAHLSMEYASKTKMGGRNIVHASATAKEAEEEIKLWFKKEELHSYSLSHQKHIY